MSQSMTTFLASFRSRWGALAAAACAGPLSLQVLAPNFVTPWPESSVVTELATIVCAVGLLLAYQAFLRRSTIEGRLVATGLALSAVCLLAYLGLWSSLLLTADQAPGQAAQMSVIRGFERLPEISAHYPEDYSNLSLWGEFQYRVESVWTTASIAVARIGTLLAYLGFFLGLTFAVALLGAHDARPPPHQLEPTG